MRELPSDLVTILRTEAKNQRTPPIDYVIAEDGGRMVHRPEPDIAMAELLEEAAARVKELEAENERLRKMLEWHPIETVPLDTIVDLWCTYAGAPASWGNGRPTGEVVRNRHKSKKYGWFGNQSDDGVPNGDGPDLLPVAWRWPTPDVPLELMERYIAALRALEGGE